MGSADQQQRTIIVDALAARYGGTAVAAVEVSRRLAQSGRCPTVIAGEGTLVAEDLRGYPDLHLLEVSLGLGPELPRRFAWEAVSLPRLIRDRAPASLLTWSGILPTRLNARIVSYLSNSLVFESPSLSNRLRRWSVGRTAGSTAHVLVPSETMALLVERSIGRRPEVVPPGVDHRRFSPAKPPGDELLCVADFYPHKRQQLVLEAWALLRDPRPRLRFIGDSRVASSTYGALTQAAAAHGHLGEVVIQERVDAETLAAAYRRSRLLVMASANESFCMPLAEAQACGVPGIVRDLPVLRETGGAGAAYIDSEDPGVWAQEIDRLLADLTAYEALRKTAVSNAQRFSWDRAAAALELRLTDDGAFDPAPSGEAAIS